MTYYYFYELLSVPWILFSWVSSTVTPQIIYLVFKNIKATKSWVWNIVLYTRDYKCIVIENKCINHILKSLQFWNKWFFTVRYLVAICCVISVTCFSIISDKISHLMLYHVCFALCSRYDASRIISYQGKDPERFYYILTGKSK